MEKKIKIILAICLVVILITVGIFYIFFFNNKTQSKCHCEDSDIDSLLGTWESLSTPRTETTYYLNGSWETIYLDSPNYSNGTWEIKNNDIIRTRYMGDTFGMGVPVEYGYEFYNDCNNLRLWIRAEEDSGYVVYMPYKKKC